MGKNKIIITKMSFNDLENIKSNLISDFDDFWTYDILKDDLQSDFSTYIVAKKNNLIIGFAGIKIILDQAEIMNIVVNKDYRNNNIGSLMLKYIITLCENKNINIINLEVNIKNTIAINLYKKYNFIQVGLRKNYYNGNDDAILMSYKLNNNKATT